ncbi:MAG: GH25 family lysozyme [Myxococcota bacterium]
MVIATNLILAANLLVPGDYGNAMGDGLKLTPEIPDPVAALNNVCAGDETLRGIDVSYYQDTINWDAVAADGVVFALIRVSHSLQFFDPQFDANWANARAAGIHAGVYQYFEPDEDPIAQADLLLDSMGPLMPGDLPPVIDVETTAGLGPAAVEASVLAWVEHVENELGVRPIIYTGPYFWQDNVGSDAFGDYPLWIAHYGTDCPLTPTPWAKWDFHQFTDSGSANGVPGNVDTNTFNGSLEDLLALGTGEVPVCGTIASDGGTIDNGDDCYQLSGNPDYWRDEAAGEGGSLVWTNATDFDSPSNYGIWRLWFDEASEYELEVHIESGYAETQQATYEISHADGVDEVLVDQSTADGWVSLGTFAFDSMVDHRVRLDDNTGESNDLELAIVFDALRVTRIGEVGSEGGDDDGGDTMGGDDASDAADDGDPDGGTGGDDGGDDATSDPGGTGGDTGDGGFDPALPGAADGDGGCGCTTTDAPPPLWLLGLFGLMLGRRRR